MVSEGWVYLVCSPRKAPDGHTVLQSLSTSIVGGYLRWCRPPLPQNRPFSPELVWCRPVRILRIKPEPAAAWRSSALPVRAVEHVTKPNRGAGGAVPGGGAGAAPPQATRSPSWLQLAAATLCAAVPSISATNAELVLTTAAPFAPTRAKHINEPSGDRAAWRAPSHSTDWRLSICPFFAVLSRCCGAARRARFLVSRRAAGFWRWLRPRLLAAWTLPLLELVIARVCLRCLQPPLLPLLRTEKREACLSACLVS